MEREYAVDNRVDGLTMRERIFCETDIASDCSGVQTEMWDYCKERPVINGSHLLRKKKGNLHSVMTLNFASAL